MKFLHTADLHIGKPFTGMGEKGDALREAQLETLERITGLARSEGVDFLVVAGDLFDSNEVKRRTVRKVADLLAGIAPIRVLLLPGTHDLLDEGSVYRSEALGQCDNVSIFGVDEVSVRVGEAAIHGRANDTKQGGIHPLAELSADPDAAYNVAVVHASVEIESKSSPDDYRVSPDEIASSAMDYVALGHWHKKSEYSSGAVTAWYSGAPEPTKYDEAGGAGFVLLVEIGPGKPDVKPVVVGKFQWLDSTLDVSTCPPGGPLEAEVKLMEGDDVILRLRLKGTIPRGEEVDAEALVDEFADAFFHLEVDDSRVSFPLDDVDGLFATGTVGDLFVARMKNLIEGSATDDERAQREKALSLGAGYISGELEV